MTPRPDFVAPSEQAQAFGALCSQMFGLMAEAAMDESLGFDKAVFAAGLAIKMAAHMARQTKLVDDDVPLEDLCIEIVQKAMAERMVSCTIPLADGDNETAVGDAIEAALEQLDAEAGQPAAAGDLH